MYEVVIIKVTIRLSQNLNGYDIDGTDYSYNTAMAMRVVMMLIIIIYYYIMNNHYKMND